MASLRETLEAPIPRPLLWVGTPILAFVLVLSFVFLGFPYDDLLPAASRELGRMTGSEARIGAIEPEITRGGPGFALREVSLVRDSGEPVGLDHLKLRPAWSTSWFQGEPAFFIDLMSSLASLEGTFTLGDSPAFSGELAVPDMARLPLPFDDTISLSGALEARGELTIEGGEAVGRIEFEAESGSATHPSLPMTIEFDFLRGGVEMGGEAWFTLDEIDMDGPIFSAKADGSVKRPGGNRPAIIDIGVELQIKNAPFRILVSGLGLPIDRNGRTAFSLGGSLQNPVLR